MHDCHTFVTATGLRLTLVEAGAATFLYVGGLRPFHVAPLVTTPVAYYSTRAGTLVFNKGGPWTWQGVPVREVEAAPVDPRRIQQNLARLEQARQLPCTVCGGSGAMHGPGMLHSHTPPDAGLE